MSDTTQYRVLCCVCAGRVADHLTDEGMAERIRTFSWGPNDGETLVSAVAAVCHLHTHLTANDVRRYVYNLIAQARELEESAITLQPIEGEASTTS